MNDAGDDREYRKRLSRTIKQMQIEEQRKQILRQFLDASAYQRIMNVKISNYDLYLQVVNVLISFAQNGRITTKLSEEQLIAIINKMTTKTETKIEYKHK